MINLSDEADVSAMVVPSFPIGAFPLLEALYPRDSSASEKAAVIVALLQMGLRSEEDL